MILRFAVILIFGLLLDSALTAQQAPKPPKPILPPAPEGVVIRQDVSYLSPGREDKLDLYLPQIARRMPARRQS